MGMIEDKIIKFRKVTELLPEVLQAIRIQNVLAKAKLMDELLKAIDEASAFVPRDSYEKFNGIVQTLFIPMETRDDILLGDYLENLAKPFFTGLLEDVIGSIDANQTRIQINDEVIVELTSSGDYTMLFRDKYFHSNISPRNEAEELTKYWDSPMEKTCLVWGLGLGYHILKMLELDPYRKIIAFEPEKLVLEIAKKYGVLREIEFSGRVEVIYDPEGKKCAEYLADESSRLLIFLPTLETMKSGPLKDSLKKYHAHFVSANNQKRALEMSFRENSVLEYRGIPDLKFKSEAHRAVIVSAGPSLDKNFRELKNRKEDTAIIATAPTLRKLYREGIIPDCTVICDTKEELKKLHEGAEDSDCPLVFSSTASVPFVQDHIGPRFILCQKGFEPAEELAKKNGWPILDSYGSVALTALVLALEKGFKEIIFIGQDLCYKGNLMHAADTSQHLVDLNTERKAAVDIFGDPVTVPINLEIFKSQIENIIRENPGIKFLNATEGGLHIEGAEDVKLVDALK